MSKEKKFTFYIIPIWLVPVGFLAKIVAYPFLFCCALGLFAGLVSAIFYIPDLFYYLIDQHIQTYLLREVLKTIFTLIWVAGIFFLIRKIYLRFKRKNTW